VNAWESLAAGGLLSLLTAEFSDLGPWLARRVTKLSARLLLDRGLGQQYDEEWLAGIERTPGRLTPLVRATGLLLISVPVLNYRYFDDWWACTLWLPIVTWNMRIQLQWPRSLTWGRSQDTHLVANDYNETLRAVCGALRSGPAHQRAEAIEALRIVLNDPPPWALKTFIRNSLQTDLPRLTGALTRRGYLPEPGPGK
jgi:hypothetical protein